MNITTYKQQKTKDTPHKMDVRPLYNKEDAQVMHISLHPGESLKPHKTPVDVFFYILEGTATILVGEESKDVLADHLVESPKDIMHCISNNSDMLVRVLVVKTPRPVTKSVF